MVDSLKFGERSDRLDRANPEPSSPACRKEGVETVRATPWLLGRGEETVQTTNMSQDMAVKTEVVRILGPEVRILSRTPHEQNTRTKLPFSSNVLHFRGCVLQRRSAPLPLEPASPGRRRGYTSGLPKGSHDP